LPDRTRVEMSPDRVQLTPTRWWTSADGRRYPVAWEVRPPDLGRTIQVDALLDDQFMDLSAEYWEGAVALRDPTDGRRLGYGYVELAGYEPSATRSH
jgi:predicted secreted hydrolase